MQGDIRSGQLHRPERRAVQFLSVDSRRAESESARPFSIGHCKSKRVALRAAVDRHTPSSRVGTSRQPWTSPICLLQGEQAALQMLLAHFAARAASFLRQGSLSTPGVQLAKHAATIHLRPAAIDVVFQHTAAHHDFHLNGCCWPQSWEWLCSKWVAGRKGKYRVRHFARVFAIPL